MFMQALVPRFLIICTCRAFPLRRGLPFQLCFFVVSTFMYTDAPDAASFPVLPAVRLAGQLGDPPCPRRSAFAVTRILRLAYL